MIKNPSSSFLPFTKQFFLHGTKSRLRTAGGMEPGKDTQNQEDQDAHRCSGLAAWAFILSELFFACRKLK